MSKHLISAFIAVTCVMAVGHAAGPQDDPPPTIQTQPPHIVLKTLGGLKIDLSHYYGRRPIYLKFWSTRCESCREQMPGVEKIHQTYGEDLAVMAINIGADDTLESIQVFRKTFDLHMPVVLDDGSLARRLNVRIAPATHVLIGVDGRIVHVGQLEDSNFHEALKRVLAEKPTTPAASAPAQPPRRAPGRDPRASTAPGSALH